MSCYFFLLQSEVCWEKRLAVLTVLAFHFFAKHVLFVSFSCCRRFGRRRRRRGGRRPSYFNRVW